MIAARSQNTECLQRLLEAGANVALRDRERWTVLHCVLRPLNLRALEILLKAPGVSDIINVPNSDGETPLSMAIGGRSSAALRLLLARGADIRLKKGNDCARACSEMWKC
eukprot:m.712380 g.712380  ORF g.712380 m.712380 type:complete len:110 (-) comp58775_c1_seq26:168-497(-)